MTLSKKRLLVMIILVTTSINLSGCSVVGMGIGTISDNNKVVSVSVSEGEVPTIEPGDEIKVALKSGEELSGNFFNICPDDSILVMKTKDVEKYDDPYYVTIPGEVLEIRFDDIEILKTGFSDSGKETGALVGVVIDVAVLIGVGVAMSGMSDF